MYTFLICRLDGYQISGEFFWKNQVDFNFSNSSWNEARINWKIIRSLRTAPIPVKEPQ